VSDFFSDNLKIADAKMCSARWFGGAGGKYFRCGFCGYKFVPGDKYRVLYTNDMPQAGGSPIVCEACNSQGDREHLRLLWKQKNATMRLPE